MILRKQLQHDGNLLFKYRSYFPLILVIGGILVFIDTFPKIGNAEWLDEYWLCCLIVACFGQLIRIISIGYSADHTSGRNTTSGQIANSINTTGMYSLCRHPLYLGNYFMWLGVAMLTMNIWFLVAFTFAFLLYYERIIYAEEAFLLEKYASNYENWAEKKPAFYPKLSLWKSPIYSFSWVKVIRQEKTGLLNLFLLFFAFHLLKEYLLYKSISMVFSPWLGLFLFSLVYYGFVKLIQKNTDLLKSDRR